jgi:hypothetical protein
LLPAGSDCFVVAEVPAADTEQFRKQVPLYAITIKQQARSRAQIGKSEKDKDP